METDHNYTNAEFVEISYEEVVVVDLVDHDNPDSEDGDDAIASEQCDPDYHKSDCTSDSSSEDDVEHNEGPEVEGLDEEGEELLQHNRKRRKRKDVNSSNWKRQTMMSLRERGNAYKGSKKRDGKYSYSEDRPARMLKPRCNCKLSNDDNTSLQCNFISDDARVKLNEELWEMTWPERRTYICSIVEKGLTERIRDRNQEEETRRANSYKYFMKQGEHRFRVCKTMFLNTFCLGEWSVRSWKSKQTGISPPNTRLKRGIGARNIMQRRQTAADFLKSLATLPSHFCRANSSKLYLEPLWDCKADVYRTYLNELSSDDVPVSRCVFDGLFEDLNLSIFRPKKDLCDFCLKYQKQLIAEEEYNRHISEKETARAEKAADKSGPHRVFTLDKQAILLAPKNNASLMFYKSKLNVHNYTLLDLKSKQGYCFIWHEANGGVTANIFATLLYHFLDKYVQPQPGETIILYSDNCTAQNKNCILSNALLNLAVLKKCTVIQKYLTVGHTQMEADNIHSCISAKVKHAEINLPSDYVKLIRETRKNIPYIVEYLTFDFFKNWEIIRFIKSIKPNGTAVVNNIKVLKYTPAKKIYYKLAFGDPYETFRTKEANVVPIQFSNLPPLYQKNLTVSKITYEHLQALKTVLLPDYHPFYDSLTYHNTEKK